MSEIEGDPARGSTRRDLLKKGAVAGAVAWTAPVLLSQTAHAAGSPPPRCVPSGQGTGFDSTGLLDVGPLGQSSGAQSCVAGVNESGLTASAICGEYDAATDTARAHVVSLNLSAPVSISNLTVASSSTTACECTRAGGTTITSGSIGGTALPSPTVPPNTTLVPAAIPAGIQVVLNEQTCEGDDFVVRAVHIFGTPVTGAPVDIKIAESRSRATGCECATE